MPRKSKGIPGLSFSWKRAVGLSGAKGKLSRQLGMPLTRSGRRRKAGAMLGCAISAWALALAAVMTALIVSCARAPAAPTASSRSPTSSVPWHDYSPAVKTRIDSAAADKDCAALQSKFNNADAGNAATRSRTGHNNSELMNYIDQSMRSAGCYK